MCNLIVTKNRKLIEISTYNEMQGYNKLRSIFFIMALNNYFNEFNN